MRAIGLFGPRDLRLIEAPAPLPGPGEVVIRTEAVGVCASDLHYYLHGAIGGLSARPGFILGHEFAGTLEEIGPGVEPRPGLEPGARVCAEPVRPCGACPECARGDYHLCRSLRFFGTPPADGALRDRVVCPSEWVFPLPDSMSVEEGAMMEPLAVGVYAAELAEMRGGETVAVVGCGAVGLSVLQACLAAGAGTVLAEDPIPERETMARSLGAGRRSGAGDADVAAECAGTSAALERSIEAVRPGGVVLVLGIPEGDRLVIPAAAARRKGLTLRFVRRYRHCFPRAIEWTAAGRTRVRPYLTHRFPLERAGDAFDLAASRSCGVVRAWIDLRGG